MAITQEQFSSYHKQKRQKAMSIAIKAGEGSRKHAHLAEADDASLCAIFRTILAIVIAALLITALATSLSHMIGRNKIAGKSGSACFFDNQGNPVSAF